MDAHLFRRLCDVLLPRLIGARMEKIHAPVPGVLVFSLYGGREHDGKRYLVLKADRRSPLLFVSTHRIPVNAQPPAFVMRLRKHLSDQRILRAAAHWTERRLYLCFSGEAPIWLLLDLREGASLSFDAPPEFSEPEWPEQLSAVPSDMYRSWPVITPALRRTIPHLDPLDADALLMDLQAGGGDVFLYDNGSACHLSAWPLPEEQLHLLGDGFLETSGDDPLPLLAAAGEKSVWSDAAAKAREAAAMPFTQEAARIGRLLKKLDADEERLTSMCMRQSDALLLQQNLYRFQPNEKAASVLIPDGDGGRVLQLDRKLTIRENMTELFRQAGRGRRGLEHLSRRRSELAAQKERAENSALRALASAASSAPAALPRSAQKQASAGRALPGDLPKQVQAFRSSDGFLMLRGRDTKGNGLALKMAAPHDYWLHTADGPSAHVIIRRDHAGQDVPERTLHEAGILAALKSWQKDQDGADIQYSLAKYIHPMKKAAPGMVRIDRSEGAFTVRLEPDLEERLLRG
ncbi:MAG: NFACT RNA binding domain-containing protein [Mailhella sp.]|nr:NFACT RNA binding domain-containing protein [Mailhella sp.]